MRRIVMMLLLFVGNIGLLNGQEMALDENIKSAWYKIGETSIDFHENRDVIIVEGNFNFAFVKFIITDAPVDLIEMEVFYEDADLRTEVINMLVKVPGESKIIDLNKGERKLKKIIFIYNEPSNRDKKGHVEIWGINPADIK